MKPAAILLGAVMLFSCEGARNDVRTPDANPAPIISKKDEEVIGFLASET